MKFEWAYKKTFWSGLSLFIFLNIFNFLNLVFNFASARLLGPIDYGILATLMSLVFIFNIPNETIQIIVSRYATKYSAEKNFSGIKNLLVKSFRKFGICAVIFFAVFLLFTPLLSIYLSIEKDLLILTGLFIFGAFLAPITRGVLQGTKRFNSLGVLYVLEGSIKLFFAIILILLGYKVYGAMIGVIFGIVISFLLSFLPLKEFIIKKSDNSKILGIYNYSLPALISIFSIMIFYSLDVLLAKVFFSPELTGKYAAVSNLGKVVFLGTWAIARAMFPLASEQHDKKKDPKRILEHSMMILFFISLVVLAIYFVFSEHIISLLYGTQYLDISSLLIFPAIAMILLSMTNIFVMYNLSINRGTRNYISVFFIFLLIILLGKFHSTLLEFSIMLIITSALFFFAMLLLILKDRLNRDYI